MSRTATRFWVILATALVACTAYWVVVKGNLPREVTAEDLQGEWVQDRDFVQHAELDAQRREVEAWEDYEFAFSGAKLTGWRLVYSDTDRDPNGWPKGRGTSFESGFTLAPEDDAAVLKFTDHAKAECTARLVWEGPKLAVTLGERKFRLIKQPAEKLRIHRRIAGP